MVSMGQRTHCARSVSGVITIEFLMLFPLIIAMLYAAAVYSIVFFSQYRMQDAVQRAVDAGLYVDRSAYPCDNSGGQCTSSALVSAVESRAQTALTSLAGALPLPGIAVAGNACTVVSLKNNVEMLRCSLTYSQVSSIVPVMSFGFLGTFPPLPSKLKVDAHAAF